LRYRYRTIEFDELDIHLRTLRDNQQFDDADGSDQAMGVPPATWALFGLIWETAEVLAEMMRTFDIKEKRILEVGCGIGLASLVLNSRHADITATDHHPTAAEFLAWNVQLNGGRDIPFVRTGWEDKPTDLGQFDLIIGSDLLYQPDHPAMLANFLDQHAGPQSQVIILDPGRGNLARFEKTMLTLGFKLDATVSPGHTKTGTTIRIRSFSRS